MTRAKTLVYKSGQQKNDSYYFLFLVDNNPYDIELKISSPSTLDPIGITTVIKNIGMVFMLDLAEIVLPEEIIIKPLFKKKQIEFWKQTCKDMIIEKIFGDHLSSSYLDVPWTFTEDKETLPPSQSISNENALLCMSGGKESLTALKILQNTKDLTLFFWEVENNTYRKHAYNELKKVFPTQSNTSNELEVWQKLMKKYDQTIYSGFDIGHLIFQSLFFSNTFSKVIIGNEYSANFGNTHYQEYEVNHQYVKTYALAQRINEYIHTYITPNFSYVSPFFGMYEYKIMELFLKDERYLHLWTSCNRTTAQKNFCCACYKCAFTYIMALAYTDKEKLAHFFSKNILDNLSLTVPLMDSRYIKPLECVGEKKEVWVALDEIYKQKKDLNSPTMSYFRSTIYPLVKDKLQEYKNEITTIYKTDLIIK